MPDESLVRGIDWRSTFPFTQIFRSFRVAIHPSKLVLGLTALLLIYFGGRLLDSIWPADSRAVPNEIGIYAATRQDPSAARAFRAARDARRKEIVDANSARLTAIGKPGGDLGDIKEKLEADRAAAVNTARTLYDEHVKSDPNNEPTYRTARDQMIATAYRGASDEYEVARQIKGNGLFGTFADYQNAQMRHTAEAGRDGRWLGPDGAFVQFVNLLSIAPGWGFRHHPIYFTIFGIYFLVIWAVFGGAIARIAAVQVARDEKISVRQALSFSTAKFLSFVSAPIIPLLIVFVVGLIVFLGALILFNIPLLGPILGGALFFLALAAGFVMTLVLIGLLGGFNLMYPTIAVEGSDSFDAISRSFSYLFARPWRLLFYTFVAIIYGTFCYVFVRTFIWLMLSLTHQFVSMGVFRTAGDSGTMPLWNAMWPDPAVTNRMTYNVDWMSLSGGQPIGAFLIAFWVYLTLAVLGAFAISFYFSANTIIYVLMRREVDATELDDVYLEQMEEEFSETMTAPAGTVTMTTTTTVVMPSDSGPSSGQPIPEAPPSEPPPQQS